MTKTATIRAFALAKFAELNEPRRRGLMANTPFRKNVMAAIMETHGTTLASAATHYNEAFKKIKELNAELVSGLGRPEDKKGGRKRKVKPEATPAPTPPLLLLTFTPTASEEVAKEAVAQQEAQAEEEQQPEAPPEQTEFTVKRKSDGSVVAENLSFEDAKALVEKAAAAKKAKLYWV